MRAFADAWPEALAANQLMQEREDGERE